MIRVDIRWLVALGFVAVLAVGALVVSIAGGGMRLTFETRPAVTEPVAKRLPSPAGPTVTSADGARVGDCLAGDSITDTTTADVSVKVVRCADPAAKYKIVGIKNRVSQVEALKAKTTVCDDFPDATYVLWQGTNVGSGDALCLGDAK